MPSQYASTSPLEELHVLMEDGATWQMIFKDLSPESVSRSNCNMRPSFLRDPLREIETYRHFLRHERRGAAHCYGASVDESCGRYWLFLEKVDGEELYTIGEYRIWKDVARWLARMHQDAADRLRATPPVKQWLKYDANYFRIWLARARDMSRGAESVVRTLGRLADRYEYIVQRLDALPVTLIHGECYASHVLVSSARPSGRGMVAVDWELAGIGTGLLDLAALISGRWTSLERRAMALAYFEALDDEAATAYSSAEDFLNAVDHCRLQLAIQWLGWSANWRPPADHDHDWFNDVLELGDVLGCL